VAAGLVLGGHRRYGARRAARSMRSAGAHKDRGVAPAFAPRGLGCRAIARRPPSLWRSRGWFIGSIHQYAQGSRRCGAAYSPPPRRERIRWWPPGFLLGGHHRLQLSIRRWTAGSREAPSADVVGAQVCQPHRLHRPCRV